MALRGEVREQGLQPMIETMRKHDNLLSLHVSDNAIGKPAGQKLGEMLEENSVLEEVDISWNDLSGEDGEQFVRGLLANR